MPTLPERREAKGDREPGSWWAGGARGTTESLNPQPTTRYPNFTEAARLARSANPTSTHTGGLGFYLQQPGLPATSSAARAWSSFFVASSVAWAARSSRALRLLDFTEA